MKKQWEESEIEFLRSNYEQKTCEEIAKELNRSTRSVQHKFGELGLKRRKAKVGDIVNGWLIKEIFYKEAGTQKVSYAKIESTLGDDSKREERLTKLTLGQVGWPDRRRPDLILRNTTHGESKSRLYRIWYGMKNRCYNEKQDCFDRYGGRGIKICDEWINDFIKFKEWAESNGYTEELTLDRIDNNGNYEPNNCKWSIWTDQIENRRCSVDTVITAFGETKSIYKWVNDPRCSITVRVLSYRIRAGWTPEDAITKKPERKTAKSLNSWLLEKYPDIHNEYVLSKND